jgi:hypothetical protein
VASKDIEEPNVGVCHKWVVPDGFGKIVQDMRKADRVVSLRENVGTESQRCRESYGERSGAESHRCGKSAERVGKSAAERCTQRQE